MISGRLFGNTGTGYEESSGSRHIKTETRQCRQVGVNKIGMVTIVQIGWLRLELICIGTMQRILRCTPSEASSFKVSNCTY